MIALCLCENKRERENRSMKTMRKGGNDQRKKGVKEKAQEKDIIIMDMGTHGRAFRERGRGGEAKGAR